MPSRPVLPPDEGRSAAPHGLRLESLAALLGFNVRMAQLAMYRDFIGAIKDLDLTQKQSAVLTLIHDNPGCSQIALAGALDTDRATMMAMVDRLQDRNLIYRARSETDRRRQELYMTDHGQGVLDEARRLIASHETRFRALFSEAELAALREMLGRIERA